MDDAYVRAAAFDWLLQQVTLHGEVIPRGLLAAGFDLHGARVPLVGPQGIFKPKVMELPLSIATSPDSPYADAFGPGDVLCYRYRGTDPYHRDNAGLRAVMERRAPLVHFHRLLPGKYLATWPVLLVGDEPAALTFTVDLGTSRYLTAEMAEPVGADPRRAYAMATARTRLHQRAFRERVLVAYREQCAICRLRHRELLEATHIVPDVESEGEPRVSNGIALCKLHHAAYDELFIGIRPDYRIEVRMDVLTEHDGPMLVHGLQGIHGTRLSLPRAARDHPDSERLAWRFDRFLAGARG